MKKIILIFIAAVSFAAVSCGSTVTPEYSGGDISLNEQSVEQLGVIETAEQHTGETEPDNELSVNENMIGMWYTYMNYKNILLEKNETEFTENVSGDFKKAADMGINTVYVQVRGFCDSYYKSDIFPKGEYYTQDFDPFEIMVNEGHKLGLSVHAWINPLRCQTEEEIKQLSNDFTVKKWYDDGEKNGRYIVDFESRLYLNPAYPEVIDLITEGVEEITENYAADGIHIDDYFYPTADESFDADAFAESGSDSLADWRRDNINRMVKAIYETVKRKDKQLVFSISPQGNISVDYNILYADVEKWASEPGFCDCIIPQIYYGFENENCPFKETAERWKTICSCDEVKLAIGLCTYKIGNEDKWAGNGRNEWIENRNVVSEQIEYCLDNRLDFTLYSFESTFSNSISEERKAISEIIRKTVTAP